MRTDLINKKESSKENVTTSINDSHDMVIAFDTTGSMSSYIESVRNHVRTLIPELLKTNPNLRIGIVAFGDYCDMISETVFGDAYQVIALTNNKNALIDFVNNASNTSGGDGNEFYELVIKKIVEESAWRGSAKKSILLISDADPHEIGYSYSDIIRNNKIDWRKEAKKASERGIQIDTLSISERPWYKELSEITNGVHAPFKSDNKTDELIKMSAYSRGGNTTKAAYITNVASYAAAGDTELNSVSCAFFKNMAEDSTISSEELETMSSLIDSIKIEKKSTDIEDVISTFETRPIITAPIETVVKPKTTKTIKDMKIDIDSIQVGDIFSEESHYIVKEKKANSITFEHLESKENVTLSNTYVQNMLNTSDQYTNVVEVGLEDKKDGTPGIRTIFENIKSSEVFTVVFTKAPKTKTKKSILEEKENQRNIALSLINKAKQEKKSMALAYKEALEYIQDNPILGTIPGEERVLRGYKRQFNSRDGKYKCQDMDIEITEKETGERFVNINTISQLIVNGTRYMVK